MSERIKIDRRVRYTKEAIRESFFALLEQKPVEKISVTEICRGADINRGTFYSHYTDPFDLRRSLADELVQDFWADIQGDLSKNSLPVWEWSAVLRK